MESGEFHNGNEQDEDGTADDVASIWQEPSHCSCAANTDHPCTPT